jgi:hypothetical protein
VSRLYGGWDSRWDRGPRVLRRWHLVVAALAALVLGVLLRATAVGVADAGRTPLTTAPAPTTSTTAGTAPAATSTPAPPPPAAGARPPGEVRVLVLNGALEGGVATTVSQALAERGYVMAPPGDIAVHPQTTVYVRAGAEADCEAVRAAVAEIRGQPAVTVPLLDPPQIPGTAGMDCVVAVGKALPGAG